MVMIIDTFAEWLKENHTQDTTFYVSFINLSLIMDQIIVDILREKIVYLSSNTVPSNMILSIESFS